MYYIDAMESEMALFDFPGLSPATESSSESLGSKASKVIKFIVKKIKEFIQRIIAIVKLLLGNSGANTVLNLKAAAVKEINAKFSQYLPNKEVTDLTKVKGLSSYQGGETKPPISEAQAGNIRQAVEQSIDMTSKDYTNLIKIFKASISAIAREINQAISDANKSQKVMDAYTKGNDAKSVLFEYRNWLTKYSESSGKSTNIKNEMLNNISVSTKKIKDQINALVTSKTSGAPEELISSVKSIISRYVSNVCITLQTSDNGLKNNIKAIEDYAKKLDFNANVYSKYADIIARGTPDSALAHMMREGCKINLELSRNLYAMTGAIKTSSSINVFSESN